MEKLHRQFSINRGDQKLSSRTKFAALAVTNASTVAVLYWNQSIIREVTQTFPSSYLVSLVPSLTLAGYAAGVAVVAFGPMPRARLSVERHLALLAVALIAASLAWSLPCLAIASFLVGCGAAAAPRLLASAAQLVKPAEAGKAIGQVVCGSLGAILCIRLCGGALAHLIGWRLVFMMAALIILGLALMIFATGALRVAASSETAFPSSLARLWRSHPLLRRAAIQQAALFAAYNASWMLVLVELPVEERSLVVIGGSCAGILAALLAGWLSDKPCQHRLAQAGAAAIFLAGSVVLPAAYVSSPGRLQVMFLVAGMALVDAGLQLALVANQRRSQALEACSRPRLAATLTVCGFLGGAIGAGVGQVLCQAFGWPAAIGFVAFCGCLGLCSSLLPALPSGWMGALQPFPMFWQGTHFEQAQARKTSVCDMPVSPALPNARDLTAGTA